MPLTNTKTQTYSAPSTCLPFLCQPLQTKPRRLPARGEGRPSTTIISSPLLPRRTNFPPMISHPTYIRKAHTCAQHDPSLFKLLSLRLTGIARRVLTAQKNVSIKLPGTSKLATLEKSHDLVGTPCVVNSPSASLTALLSKGTIERHPPRGELSPESCLKIKNRRPAVSIELQPFLETTRISRARNTRRRRQEKTAVLSP